MTFNISFGADVDGLYLYEVCEDTGCTSDEKKEKITVWSINCKVCIIVKCMYVCFCSVWHAQIFVLQIIYVNQAEKLMQQYLKNYSFNY